MAGAPDTTTPSAELVEIATRLRVSISAYRRRGHEVGNQGGLTGPQLLALKRLEQLGAITIAELARHEQITPQAMGATVAGLETLHLLTRTADPTHGRRQLLTITDTGRAALNSGREALVAKIAVALARHFTADEIATLQAATPLIERLSQAF